MRLNLHPHNHPSQPWLFRESVITPNKSYQMHGSQANNTAQANEIVWTVNCALKPFESRQYSLLH